MINFILRNFIVAHDSLKQVLDDAAGKAAAAPQDTVSAADHRRVAPVIDLVADQCVQSLSLREPWDTIQELFYILGNHHVQPYTWGKFHSLLETLVRQINRHLQEEFFFHYPREMARLWRSIEEDWKSVLAQTGFPSARHEIEAGIDCFALGDYPGCIFHMLRIAEKGLRAVAYERGVKTVRNNKPIKYAMWGEVIIALRSEIDALHSAKGNTKPLTDKKRENREIAVEFYSTIMGDIQALLPLRDRTFHLRDKYDKGEAWTAINRTKEMMAVMATKLGEVGPRKIRWGL